MSKFKKGDMVRVLALTDDGVVWSDTPNAVGKWAVLWPEGVGHINEMYLSLVEPSKEESNATPPNEDMVNTPTHYTSDPSGVECITIVRHRNFNVGNAIKYLWRNGLKKDSDLQDSAKQVEDLEKAVFYIKDEIKRLQALTEDSK